MKHFFNKKTAQRIAAAVIFSLASWTANAQAPQIHALNLSSGMVGMPYNEDMRVSNNPTSCNVTTGALPPGLRFEVYHTGYENSCRITGTPTQAGYFSFTLTASNAAGASDPNSYFVFVEEKPETLEIVNVEREKNNAKFKE